ncbi:MAG: H4MPT-linked C1 transfer pathway protein [Proteobacteria bacterium]|nr:H4MPT-linked C1 transfer pathway protein [Pseudomonadota bacterium]NOG59237.1 H4MPT-linked C1 transfer pathway protein [Pseudomonadota bacterium]
MYDSNYIGWDIGGAHLKIAAVNETGKLIFVEQYALPIWQGISQLEDLIPKVLKMLPSGSNSHAVTITAELSDIFKDREEGVHLLINVLKNKLGADVNLYAVDNGLLDLDNAKNSPSQIASANWHASASYTALLTGSGVFIDIGSTTTDIISFSDNKINNRGVDDQSRLRFDELVYTGVIRTPLMALANKVPFNGEWQNIAAENFATTADINRILSYLNEGDDLMETADGNNKDVEGSLRRLARMLGMDFINSDDTKSLYELAEYFEKLQLQLLTKSVLTVLSNFPDNDTKIIGAGVGSFLIKKIAQKINVPFRPFSDLCDSDEKLHHKCNVCAPAVAVAQLNRQNL